MDMATIRQMYVLVLVSCLLNQFKSVSFLFNSQSTLKFLKNLTVGDTSSE